ncbi:MAG: hypothetical protein ACQKBW_09915 [Puniceicoccales bacterium]
MKACIAERIWPPSKKDLKRGALWYVVLVVTFTVLTIYKDSRAGEALHWGYVLFSGWFAGTACFVFLLLLIHYPLKIIPRIASWAEARAVNEGSESSENRGRLIATWGLRLYLLFMFILNAIKVSQNDGKNWGWAVFWFLLTCWLFSSIKQGMKPVRNFVSFLLILGVYGVFRDWKWLGTQPLAIYTVAFSAYGFMLGLILLLSKDVNYYMVMQYEKLPKQIKKKLR